MTKKLLEDWEFGVLGIYNYRRPGKFDHYFRELAELSQTHDGDLCEVGVFKGASLLAQALFLKEIGSPKKIYGFDSFSGFPSYHANDELEMFAELHHRGAIGEEQWRAVQLNQRHRGLFVGKVTAQNISSSGEFADAPYDVLMKKLDYLGLDNVVVVKGPFAETMAATALPGVRFCAALVDCDLYDSYTQSLPFIWERLQTGGYVYLDEYYSLKFPGARIATDEFFAGRADRPCQHRRLEGDFERWFVRKLRA